MHQLHSGEKLQLYNRILITAAAAMRPLHSRALHGCIALQCDAPVVSCVDRVSYWYRRWMPRWRRTASFEIRSSLLVYLHTCSTITTTELLETRRSLCIQCTQCTIAMYFFCQNLSAEILCCNGAQNCPVMRMMSGLR